MTSAPSTAALDLRDRDAVFDALGGEVFDLAVIGGGITGAGVARDAALRGLSVALVEARDFASGTSSRSSKMIHGGLRYLAQGDLALVREAASERKIVEAIAPHLARRTPFVMPVRNAAAEAKLRAGLWTFEKLGAVPKARHHEVWSRADLIAREPAIEATGLTGAVVYPEYLTDDARLTLANVRSAAAAGARVANYAAVLALVLEGGRAVALEVADTLAGGEHRVARLRARIIVNAAGPWVDAVRALESPGAAPRLALARGVHLVVRRARLPVDRVVIMPAADKRSVFAVPRGPVTYIGTTDTFHPVAEAWPPVTVEDADYLLAAAAARFSTPRLTVHDIVSAWSGVRPLVAEEGKSASDISRRDELWTGPAGVLSIAGGKLTAYRRMSERVVDQVQTALGRPVSPSATADQTLPGGDADPGALRAELLAGGRAEDDVNRLVGLYGAEVGEVLAAGAGPAVEADRAVLVEGALTLEDYWARRGARARFDPDGGLGAL
ncbi:MAG: glycerol-3-phosphate dehydrogenase, partial [Caulobacteraceae bacterium]|nr:glycerol-3-phosphate dehydrogenase [Caulobacteraceae bacterium]